MASAASCAELRDIRLATPNVCSQFDLAPSRCVQHRVGRTPCAFKPGTGCRRDRSAQCERSFRSPWWHAHAAWLHSTHEAAAVLREQELAWSRALAAEGGWRVWTPDEPALEAANAPCSAVRYHHPMLPLVRAPPITLCLAPNDFITRRVEARGRWDECELLTTLYDPSASNASLPAEVAGASHEGASGLVLDLGANQGLCTYSARSSCC
jgi:hypothetical protein